MLSTLANEHVEITEADRERFYRDAEDAIGRFQPESVRHRFSQAGNWLLAGAIPLVGHWYFNWSAIEWLRFVIISSWCSIVFELIELHFRFSETKRRVTESQNDKFVWAIGKAIQEENAQAPVTALRKESKPFSSIWVSVVLAMLGTSIIANLYPQIIGESMSLPWTWIIGIAGIALYRIGFLVWRCLPLESNAISLQQEEFRGYKRGLGILLLGLLVAFLHGDPKFPHSNAEQTSSFLVIILNGSALIMAALIVMKFFTLQPDIGWLRSHLSEQKQSSP